MLLKVNDDQTTYAASPPSRSNLIGVIGAKGGVGATTVALNLASALAFDLLKDKSVTLLDANLQQSDLATLTAQQPRYTFADLFNRQGDLEEGVFNACTYGINNGQASPHLVSPSTNLEAAMSYDLSSLVECMPQITKFSHLVLLDLPKQLDQNLVNLLDQCQSVLLVFEPTLQGISAARRWLTYFEDLGYSNDKIILIVNRSGGKVKDIEKKLGDCFVSRQIVYLPNAFSQLQHACLTGMPLVIENERHAYSQAIKQLASLILDKVEI